MVGAPEMETGQAPCRMGAPAWTEIRGAAVARRSAPAHHSLTAQQETEQFRILLPGRAHVVPALGERETGFVPLPDGFAVGSPWSSTGA